MNMESFVSDHRRVEERSLRLHEAIVEKLRTNPKPVLRRARTNIERARSDPYPQAIHESGIGFCAVASTN